MAIKNAFRIPVTDTFVAAGHVYLYSPHIPEGKIYCFQQVAWEIDTATAGGETRCRLLIEGHGYNHYLEEQNNPVVDTLYTYNEKVWLVPRERLALEIDHAGAGTVAQMWLTGYWTKFEEGVVT